MKCAALKFFIGIAVALAVSVSNHGTNTWQFYAAMLLVGWCFNDATLLLVRMVCRQPKERWEDGSIDGLPARRSLHSGDVQIPNVNGGWISTGDPLNEFLPLSQEPRTSREWNERLRYLRMKQPKQNNPLVAIRSGGDEARVRKPN